MEITAKAPGKLILIGEYAVLEGSSALVMATERYAISTIKASHKNSNIIRSSNIKEHAFSFSVNNDATVSFSSDVSKISKDKLKYFILSFEKAYKTLTVNNSLPPLSINIDTSDFFWEDTGVKLGLGSSAAVTTSIYGGLLSYWNQTQTLTKKYSKKNLFYNANSIHKLAQDKMGSGIDIAASVFGGVLQYQLVDKGKPNSAIIQKIDMPSSLHILPVWTGKQASTTKMVSSINNYYKKERKVYHQFIDEMAELSQQGCLALTQNSTSEFLAIIKSYYQVIKIFGEKSGVPIISKLHKKLADIVYQSGHSVYKSSGAGGGDFGIVISQSEDELIYLKNKIEKNGFKIFDIGLSHKGFQVS